MKVWSIKSVITVPVLIRSKHIISTMSLLPSNRVMSASQQKILKDPSRLIFKIIKFFTKHYILCLIFSVLIFEVKLGFIQHVWKIQSFSVLGDDITFEKSKKVVENLQEGVKILSTITGNISMIILNQRMCIFKI